MRTPATIVLALLLLAPAHAQEQQHPRPEGAYDLVSSNLIGRAYAYVSDEGGALELTSTNARGETWLRMLADPEPVNDAWVFRRVEVQREGLTQGIEGRAGSNETQDVLRLKPAADGEWTGELERRGRTYAAALRVRNRLLMVTTSYRKWNQKYTSWIHGRGVRNTYQARGYTVVERKVDSFEAFISLLEGFERDPFRRVVLIVHSGEQDGPVLAFNRWSDDSEPPFPGTRQVSLRVGKDLWPDLVEAYTQGTTPDAKIYLAGCRTGGLNAEGRHKRYNEIPIKGYHDTQPVLKDYFTGAYVEELAQATGRIVIGPSGLTNWNRTTKAVQAMEGVGGVPQETRIAYPDGRAIQVDEGETHAAAIASAPSMRVEPASAALGDDVELMLTNFEAELPEVWINGGRANVLRRVGLRDKRQRWTVRVPSEAAREGRVKLISGGHTLLHPFSVEGNLASFEEGLTDAGDAIRIGDEKAQQQLQPRYELHGEVVFDTWFEHPEIEAFRVVVTGPEDERLSFEWYGPMDKTKQGHRTTIDLFHAFRDKTGRCVVQAYLRTRRGETLFKEATFEVAPRPQRDGEDEFVDEGESPYR